MADISDFCVLSQNKIFGDNTAKLIYLGLYFNWSNVLLAN